MKIDKSKLVPQVDDSDNDIKIIDDSKHRIQNGETRPILVSSEDAHIIDGNHTLKAYQELGLEPPEVYVGTSKDFFATASEANYNGVEMIKKMIQNGTATLAESYNIIKEDNQMNKETKSKPGHKIITLDIKDSNGCIEDLLRCIGATAEPGHTFPVIVDPDDSEFRQEFCIDGDGWDRIEIKSVEVVKEDESNENEEQEKDKKQEGMVHELGDFQDEGIKDTQQSSKEVISEISTNLNDTQKIENGEIKSYEDFVELYKGVIDIKYIQDYGSINDKDEKLWKDIADELYLQSKNYIPVIKKDKKEESKIKGMSDWKTNLDIDFKVGDLVDDELINEIINQLPPKTLNGEVVQMGEPYSANDRGATYITFIKDLGNKTEGHWMYVGPCNIIEKFDDYKEDNI